MTHRRPVIRLLALALAVASVHAMLWQGMASSFAASAPPTRQAPALQVRTVAMPATTAPAAPVVAQPAPIKKKAVRPPTMPAPVVDESTSPAVEEPAVLVAAALPVVSDLELTPVALPIPKAEDVPVYRTTLPPAMTLSYDMRRGPLSGNGQLVWRHSDAGYQARLEGKVAGMSILTWASEGTIDSAGIAPARFTDQRRNKSPLAANFQRQAGKITYSGNPAEYPLLKGTQDRLSWMIQIAAIANAEPKKVSAGGRVTMFVTGARGDADAWSFKVQGVEEVRMGDERVRAIKLLREPRKPHDTRVEVWLAPSLHHLPVRARLSSDDSALELNLQAAQPAS